MDMKTAAAIASQIDESTAKSFVSAAWNVIQAAMVVRQQALAAETPGQTDYETAQLDRSTPAGGWLTDETLHSYTQRISEAIAAEKWEQGALFVLQFLAIMRP
jgi:hypothetical protein